MKGAIVVFPGSNCERDTHRALGSVGAKSIFVWHKETHIESPDFIIIPGGFSYGDYLRAGAIAKASPVMVEIRRHAKRGVSILGICNGFQILLEAGLLPGAMQRNATLHFICKQQYLISTMRTASGKKLLRIPVAHGEGNYWTDGQSMEVLKDNEQIIFRYCDEEGVCTEAVNPNGSRFNIAGICSKERNVIGMMPHPERACDDALGSVDGREIFLSFLNKEV